MRRIQRDSEAPSCRSHHRSQSLTGCNENFIKSSLLRFNYLQISKHSSYKFISLVGVNSGVLSLDTPEVVSELLGVPVGFESLDTNKAIRVS